MGKKIDLIPCPHCGGIKISFDDNDIDPIIKELPDAFWAVCQTCFATGGPGKSRKEAADNWNRRTP